MARVKVELWGDHPEAIQATRDTIAQLPTGRADQLEEIGGEWYLDAPDFIVWACERQGYVKRVIRYEEEMAEIDEQIARLPRFGALDK